VAAKKREQAVGKEDKEGKKRSLPRSVCHFAAGTRVDPDWSSEARPIKRMTRISDRGQGGIRAQQIPPRLTCSYIDGLHK
jgi:hypothetical protein